MVTGLWQRLRSRKFIAVMVAALWYLISGTLNGTLESVGWTVLAIILGYLVSEGAKDALIAYWNGKNSQKG